MSNDFYNPRFDKSYNGGFDKKSSICSIKGGTDSYLLENEFNQSQWIQLEKTKEIIHAITDNGCINKYSESFYQDYYNNFNTFYLAPFKMILNGDIVEICDKYGGNITVTLEDPPTNIGKKRYDLVYIECWKSEVSYIDKLYNYGGVDNDVLRGYTILDSDINVETSRRIQIQWKIRIESDVDIEKYPNGFESENGQLAPKLAKGKSINQDKFYYIKDNNYKNVYVAGLGDSSAKTIFDSVDGNIFAMPLAIVERMNSAGYHPEKNPNGSNNLVDETSIPENDGKFSNLIYLDQINNLKPATYINLKDYKNIFVTISEFSNFEKYIENIFNEGLIDIEELRIKLEKLIVLVNDYVIPDLNLKAYISDVKAWLKEINDKIYELSLKVDKNTMMLEDHEIRIKHMEEFLKMLEFDPDGVEMLKYGIVLRKRAIKLTGGEIQSNEIVCVGTIVDTQTTSENEYVSFFMPMHSSNNGSIGEYWTSKSDSACIVNNTGYSDLSVRNYILLLEPRFNGCDIRYRELELNDQNSTPISDVSISEEDFVLISPKEYNRGSTGDIILRMNKLDTYGSILEKTGEFGTKVDLVVINTKMLRNVDIFDIELNGVDKSYEISGAFGDTFDMIVSCPVIDINDSSYIGGTIGEFNINKNYNSFTIEYTGNTVCKLKCIVFKEVNL